MVMHRSLQPECVAAYKEAFAQCQEATLQEPGCLGYGLYQSPKDSTEFLLYENCENDSVLALHGKTAHLKAFLQTTKEMFTAKNNKKVYVCPE